jgi:hypothetical protein
VRGDARRGEGVGAATAELDAGAAEGFGVGGARGSAVVCARAVRGSGRASGWGLADGRRESVSGWLRGWRRRVVLWGTFHRGAPCLSFQIVTGYSPGRREAT